MVRPSTLKTIEILKIVREELIGLTYVEQEGWTNQSEGMVPFAMSLVQQIGVLDLFLTGSLRGRTTQVDVTNAWRIYDGHPWKIVLSDESGSILVARKPTNDDQRYLYLDQPSREVAFRWSLIDIPAAQPTEFQLQTEYLR